MKWYLRRLTAAALTVGVALGVPLAGCGGGSNPGTTRRASAPTDATRARVQSLLGQSTQSAAFFSAGAGFAAGGGAAPSEDSVSGGAGSVRNHPQLGAFFQQSAVRNATAGRAVTRQVGDGSSASDPGNGFDPHGYGNAFYYDDFLGLWTEFSSTPGKTTYLLYEDEAKTKPAGEIVTEQPTDYETFPQVYRSRFQFNGGFLKGSHGYSNNTVIADYSGSSEYENVYSDGGKSTGTSRWSGSGDSTYKSRDEMADGSWAESAGTFRSNGSGGTRYKTSDGDGAEYTYNADGSGRGKITGDEPGLPATIVWDNRGNTTITYADGTVERYGWDFWYGGGGVYDYGDGIGDGEPLPASSEPAG